MVGGRCFFEAREESLLCLPFHGLPVFQKSESDKLRRQRNQAFSRIGLYRLVSPGR